jgi:hypothetical protein
MSLNQRWPRRAFALLACLLGAGPLVVGASAETPEGGSLQLWYRRPPPRWDHGIPLGNGRLGAMIVGDARRERIQLNES